MRIYCSSLTLPLLLQYSKCSTRGQINDDGALSLVCFEFSTETGSPSKRKVAAQDLRGSKLSVL